MPTATGKPTADEKREQYRYDSRTARLTVTGEIAPIGWYEDEADAWLEGFGAFLAEVEAGTKQSYNSYEVWYPAGREFEVKVGRKTFKVDEGQARAYGVADMLEARGISVHNTLSFGLFAGRNTIRHSVSKSYDY
jgi:hypothetical protein